MCKWGLFQGCKTGSVFKKINVIHLIERVIKKNYIIISTNGVKAFDKIQHTFLIKIIKKIGIEVTSSTWQRACTKNLQLPLYLLVEDWMLPP